jgi:hypothetical protein
MELLSVHDRLGSRVRHLAQLKPNFIESGVLGADNGNAESFEDHRQCDAEPPVPSD